MVWNVEFWNPFWIPFWMHFGRCLGKLEIIKTCIFNKYQIMILLPFLIIITFWCGSNFGSNLDWILEPFWHRRGFHSDPIWIKIPSQITDLSFEPIKESFLECQKDSKICPKVDPKIDPKMIRTKPNHLF